MSPVAHQCMGTGTIPFLRNLLGPNGVPAHLSSPRLSAPPTPAYPFLSIPPRSQTTKACFGNLSSPAGSSFRQVTESHLQIMIVVGPVCICHGVRFESLL